VGKFTAAEGTLIKSIVACLTIKRIPETEIIHEIFRQTNKTISSVALFKIRNRIKKESYHWYKTMREGQYEYLHEFKERINEIMQLQQKHHSIIAANEHDPGIQQTSLIELHKLSITLSNLYEVAPSIINNGPTVSVTPETKAASTEPPREFIV
jgi:protein-arginine kinase